MKAAILHDFKQQLSIEDVERPRPAADEVLIQVEACGACHSDVHVADGDWKQLVGIVKRPLILGHEIAGHVVEKGEAVDDLQIGDRVGVPWIHSAAVSANSAAKKTKTCAAGRGSQVSPSTAAMPNL